MIVSKAKIAKGFDRRRSETTLNERAVFGLTAVVMLIAFLPVAAAIGRWWVVSGFAASVALGIVADRSDGEYISIRDAATAHPQRQEFVLAAIKEFQSAAIAGLFLLGFFEFIEWLVSLLNHIVNLPGSNATIAAVVTLIVSVVVILGVTMISADEIAKKLYPATAGIPGGFSELVKDRQRLVVAVEALVAVAVVGFALLAIAAGSIATWGVILYLLALFVITVPLTPQEHDPVRDRPDPETLDAAVEAFGKERTVTFPRSGDGSVDPLLLDVDLLVHSDADDSGNALAVDLKHRSSTPVDWTLASSLVTATRAMETVIGDGVTVHPVLLLIDVGADDTLRTFCLGESVTLVELETETGDIRLTSDLNDPLVADASKRLLDLLPREDTPEPTTADVGKPVEAL